MSLLYNWILNYSYYFIHWSRGHYYYNIILQNYVLLSADSFAILYIHILTWRRLLNLCTVYIISWVVEYLHDTHHELGAAGEPPAALVHHAGDDVNGHREHDGAVVLRWYTVQSLQVPQLKHSSIYRFLWLWQIYDTVYRLRSFLPSLGHLVTQSLGHSVTWSLGHLVTWLLCHYFILTFCFNKATQLSNWLTNIQH